MPWRPLPKIAFAIATYPFEPSSPEDLPLELGDELYIIEEGGKDWSWCRGYLVALPSILAGLTSVKGRTLEARVFSGIFPRACVTVKEYLENTNGDTNGDANALEDSASTVQLADSNTRHASDADEDDDEDEDVDDDGSIGPDDSASQISISEDSRNGHIRVRKRRKKSLDESASKQANMPTKQNHALYEFPSTTPNSDTPKVKPPAPVPMLKIGDSNLTSRTEPLIDEIASCLREWYSTNLHELTLSRQYSKIEKLSKLQKKLDNARRQMQTGALTKQELEKVREKTVWNLVKGNKMLSNEVIVRDPHHGGRLLTSDDNVLEVASLQAQMSLLKKPILPTTEVINLHHLLFELKDVNTVSKDKIQLFVAIYIKEDDKKLRPLTESYSNELPTTSPSKSGMSQFRTLFSDLAASDVGDVKPFGTKIYLVIKAQARFDMPQSSSRRPSFNESSGQSKKSIEDTKPTLQSRRSLIFGSKGFSSTRNKQTISTQPSISEGIDSVGHSTDKSASVSTVNEKDVRLDPPKPASCHRDIGYALMELQDFAEITQGVDRTIDLWNPAESSTEAADLEDVHTELLNELFALPDSSYVRSQSLSHLRFRIQSFQSRDADDLIRATPTILHDAKCSPKIGFSGVPDKSRSDIYLTISDAHLAANGMLSHPTKGAVPMAGISDSKNLLLKVEVKLEDGRPILDCITGASNVQPVTCWQSNAVSRGYKWSHTLKLSIPKDQVIDSHVVMAISDGIRHPFGICYLPLWSDGAFISDGPHDLLFYQNDQVVGRIMGDRLAYLHLGWSSKPKTNRQSWAYDMALLRVRTDLVSTCFSQNQVLLSVLNWKDQSDDDLIKAIRQLRNVLDLELVKFIPDVLNALFGILVQRSGNDEFEDLIFRSVVEVLTIAQSKRFNLTPAIDDYTHNKFNFPFAAPCLMRSYLRLIVRRSDENNSRHFRATLKVSRQVLKFILQARKQQIRKEEYIGISNSNDQIFLREIKKLFAALEDQMRDQTPSSIGNKTLLVQSVHTWLPDLLNSFGERETAALAVSFIEACSHVAGKLVMHKLVSIWNLVKLSLECDVAVRAKIQAEAISWISQYWGYTTEIDEQYREQVRLCVSICALWNGRYGSKSLNLYMKTVQSFHCITHMAPEKAGTFSLLFPSTYPFPTKPTDIERNYNECLIELSALKATFKPITFSNLDYMTEDHLDTIIKALGVDVMILQARAFPKNWITYHAFYHRVVMDSLQVFTDLAPASGFIPAPEESDSFNLDLWKAFLDALLVVVRSDALTLETLPEQRRKAVWRIVGDLREKGAQLLSLNWHTLGWPADQEDEEMYGLTRLGGYQVQYVPSLVGPIVELCLGVHEGLRRAAVEVLRSMIISEHDLNGDITAIQIEMVRTLNEFFKTKSTADTGLQRQFIDQLMEGFHHLRDSEERGIWKVCHDLVLAIDRLLDLLVAAHSPDQHESLALLNTLALLDFLRSIQKDDIFIEYAHQLAEIQAKDRNYQEAGLALRLHADLYQWDLDTKVEELKSPRMPAQTMFDRKEEIYMKMIEQYEKGFAWGAAMDCYLELAHQYQYKTFNFSKLAKAQHSIARIHESIAKGEGEASRYFHVEFTGLGFPATVKDSTFIYEGLGTERLTGFNDRLQKQYPVAKLLDAGDQIDVGESEGQYIKIAVVQVYHDFDQPILRRAKVPLSTKEFVLSSKPKLFSMTVAKHTLSASEYQTTDKIVFSTSEAFPTILRRSQVSSQSIVHLSAIETAIERVLRKTFELRHLSRRVSEKVSGSLKVLADAIKSQVDPASKGSVTTYRPLLQKHQSEAKHDDTHTRKMVAALDTALLDFASLLRDALPLLQNTKHHLEYKSNAILFKSTFEPELATISNMAPLTLQQIDDQTEVRSEIYSIERSSMSVQSLPNGYLDVKPVNSQTVTPQTIENRGRLRSSFRQDADSESRPLYSRGVSSNGEALAPSFTVNQRNKSTEPNGNRSGSTPSTRQTEQISSPSLKAVYQQSLVNGSENTNRITTNANTSRTRVTPVNEKSSQAAISRQSKHQKATEGPKQSYSTHQSLSPTVKSATGSIRKRLSAFGMSKKVNKLLVAHEGVQEEDT